MSQSRVQHVIKNALTIVHPRSFASLSVKYLVNAYALPAQLITYGLSNSDSLLMNNRLSIPLEEVVNNLPGAIYRFRYLPDGNSCLEFISESVKDIFRVTPEELYQDNQLLWNIIHPDDRKKIFKRMMLNIKENQPWHYHWRICRPDGETRWVSSRCGPPKVLEDGSKVWNGVFEDVTSEYTQVTTATDLHDTDSTQKGTDENIKKLYSMLDGVPGGVFQSRHYPDGHFEFIYISETAVDLLGLSRESLQADALTLQKTVHPDDAEQFFSSIQTAVYNQKDWVHSWRVIVDGVKERWLRGRGRHYATLPDGSILRVSLCMDISHEKSLESQITSQQNALYNNEKTLKQITDVIAGVITKEHYDTSGPIEFHYVSQGARELFGVTSQNLMADCQIFWRLCHPDDLNALQGSLQKALSNQSDWVHSWRIQRPDGETRHIRVSSRHYRTLEDQTSLRVSSYMDITHEAELEGERQKLEDDVAETRQLLLNVNNAIPGCVYLIRRHPNHQWDYPFMSAAATTLFERPVEELKKNSRLLLEYAHPDDRDMLDAKLRTATRYNSRLHVVWRIITPSGKVKWLRGDSKPFRTEHDGTILRAGFLVDVTRERQLEEQLDRTGAQLQQILEAIPGSVTQTRIDHKTGKETFVFANKHTWAMAGLPEDTTLDGNKATELNTRMLPEDFEDYTQKLQVGMETMQPVISPFRVRRFDNNELVSLELHATPSTIKNSKDMMLTGVALDITERAQMEEDLKEQKIRAEEANRAKSTFLANVSHEMRTPLNGILGYAQLLSHELDLSGLAARNLKALNQCSSHLLAVINEVLDMAKIESGRLDINIKPLALYRLISDVESVVAPLADNKDLLFQQHIGNDLPGYIKGDATRLRQILINLLNNAVKFTKKGEVNLSVTLEDNDLLFKIQDTGSGIPEDRLKNIFQPFERLKTHSSEEGTGLGLAITQRIVEVLQGTITLESSEHEGSCFTVRLPCEEADAMEEQPDTSEFNLQKINITPPPAILVVDDRESNRDVMQQWLTLGGFTIVTAANGQEGLDKLRQQPFSMVLSDLRMPVMSGQQMMAAIKNDTELQPIPVVAISASVFPEHIRKVLKEGFKAFLPKPCELRKLFNTIYDILDLHPESAIKTPKNEASATVAPVANIPDEIRKEVLAMLDMGDIEGLHQKIQSLYHQPGLEAHARKLDEALDDFDMDGFRRLLQDF